MKYLATLALASLTTATALAQVNLTPCATDEHFEQRAQQNPALREYREQIDEMIQNMNQSPFSSESVVHIVPVVVHVMYYNEQDSISVAQIEDAIDVLNEDYSQTNADASNVRSTFAAAQANMEIEFRLAKIDPSGNSTTGINYKQSDRSLGANNQIKGELNWPADKYLNIWVVRAIDLGLPPSQGTILGYAAFPYAGQQATDDGIVIRHDQMGRIGTAVSNGRTLTHEAGHYFNLYHPFQGGCTGSGDLCADTPPVANPSYGCNFQKSDCGSLDMIENFMDYTNDVCVNTFTNDQKSRAKYVLGVYALRGDLTSQANLGATGVNGVAVNARPTARFSTTKHVACLGEAVDFLNLSASHDANTTYNWEFTSNGNTVTSSQENPSMTFNNTGVYNVKLTVTNGNSSHSVTKTADIEVIDPAQSYYDNHFTATFENDLPNATWSVIDDLDGRTWQTTSDAAYAGSKSVMFPTYVTRDDGVDHLQSTAILVDETSFATFSFHYAWARRESANQDRLNISVSTDCGETWQLVRLISSFQLNTAGANVAAPFIPTAGQWTEVQIPLDNYIGADPMMIRLTFNSNGGNNLYIDEARLDVSIGTREQDMPTVDVYPNPASTTFQIVLSDFSTATWSLTALNGVEINSGNVENGRGQVNVSELAAGVYILRIESEKGVQIEKVIVE